MVAMRMLCAPLSMTRMWSTPARGSSASGGPGEAVAADVEAGMVVEGGQEASAATSSNLDPVERLEPPLAISSSDKSFDQTFPKNSRSGLSDFRSLFGVPSPPHPPALLPLVELRATLQHRYLAVSMSFGRPPTFSDFKVSPPERGSFPLDHEGKFRLPSLLSNP